MTASGFVDSFDAFIIISAAFAVIVGAQVVNFRSLID